MSKGRVTKSLAYFGVPLEDGAARTVHILAAIDTGYNGSIALPSDFASSLSLPFAGFRRAKLANGSVVVMKAYTARVRWHGKLKNVLVADGAFAPIIGMGLIHGSRVTIDAIDGGDVTIVELPG